MTKCSMQVTSSPSHSLKFSLSAICAKSMEHVGVEHLRLHRTMTASNVFYSFTRKHIYILQCVEQLGVEECFELPEGPHTRMSKPPILKRTACSRDPKPQVATNCDEHEGA